MKNEDFLEATVRAEDILLGSLGFGEEARLLWVELTACGYRGRAVWPDGEEFDFESDEEPDDLQLWALGVLGKIEQKQAS
ncbi:MAG: hypothetical protein D6719_02970 [Candidatus Dadabacteria bacterium]|nr:MAG: hypothetical protein D6719_02970 [Candidatus Dadabacteria bacterium]